MGNIKEWVIHKLGGFTTNDFKVVSQKVIRATTKSYYIDEDTMAYDTIQIARKIGEQLLYCGMIHFDIDPKEGKIGETLYTISGEIPII